MQHKYSKEKTGVSCYCSVATLDRQDTTFKISSEGKEPNLLFKRVTSSSDTLFHRLCESGAFIPYFQCNICVHSIYGCQV